ncbi:MAG TPA: hypothetical protein VGP52_01140 [Stellaceae bacterium]|jgi:hypothetical protein|nr:hypothetical protein [Stellaceae bacterium]
MSVESLAGAIRHIWYLVISPLLNLLFLSVIAAQFTTNTPATLMAHTFNTIVKEFPGVCGKKQTDNPTVNVSSGIKVGKTNRLSPASTTKSQPLIPVSGNVPGVAHAEERPIIVNTSSPNHVACDKSRIFDDVKTGEIFIHQLFNDNDAKNVINSIAETIRGLAKISAITFLVILLIFSLFLDYITLFCAELIEVGAKWISNRRILSGIKNLVTQFRTGRSAQNLDNIACIDFARRCLDNRIFPHDMDEYQIQEASLAWLSQNAKEGHWKIVRSALVERQQFWRYVNQHVGIYIVLWVILAVSNQPIEEVEWIAVAVLLPTWLLGLYNTLTVETELREHDIGSFCYYRMAGGSIEGQELSGVNQPS